MRVKILVNDAFNRFSKGEEGVVLEDMCNNDCKKYDFLVQLPPFIAKEDDPPFLNRGQRVARNFYFYKSEVEIIDI